MRSVNLLPNVLSEKLLSIRRSVQLLSSVLCEKFLPIMRSVKLVTKDMEEILLHTNNYV